MSPNGAFAQSRSRVELHARRLCLCLCSRSMSIALAVTRRTDTCQFHPGQVASQAARSRPATARLRRRRCVRRRKKSACRLERSKILGQIQPVGDRHPVPGHPHRGTNPLAIPLRTNASEVDLAFEVPLAFLSDPDNLERKPRQPLAPGHPIDVYYFRPYRGEVIWGVTARITVDLLNIVRSL